VLSPGLVLIAVLFLAHRSSADFGASSATHTFQDFPLADRFCIVRGASAILRLMAAADKLMTIENMFTERPNKSLEPTASAPLAQAPSHFHTCRHSRRGSALGRSAT
jgi:hypothetical protein